MWSWLKEQIWSAQKGSCVPFAGLVGADSSLCTQNMVAVDFESCPLSSGSPAIANLSFL